MHVECSRFEFSSVSNFGDWFFPFRLIVVLCIIAGGCASGTLAPEERFSTILH